MASGKDSPQYKIVKNNLKHIVGTLKSNTAAHDAMRMSMKSEGWLEVYTKPTAEDLVSIIQNRIELEVCDYDVFMDMLRNTDGMDQIAKKLQLPGGAGPEDVKTLGDRVTKDGHSSAHDQRQPFATFTPAEEPRTLSIDDIQDVLVLLVDVKKEWYSLGLVLGLRLPTLKEIKQNEDDIDDCKREMVAQWLNQVDNSKPTYASLEAALRNPTVKCNTIAENVRKHCAK